MHQEKDRGSKWMIGLHGDSILRLGGFSNPRTWQPLQAELIAPRRFPDGVIEATFEDSVQPELVLIEIETFANNDMDRQVFEDLLLIALERGIIPEVVILVLRPKGKVRAKGRFKRSSQRNSAHLTANWRVVELWKLKAEELLAAGDVGLIPWVPLAQTDMPAKDLLETCRERIDRDAPRNEIEGLKVVTTIMASLVYPPRELLEIFGEETMINIPIPDVLKEMAVEAHGRKGYRAVIISLLKTRFGIIPLDRLKSLDRVSDQGRLDELMIVAANCTDLEAFIAQLQ